MAETAFPPQTYEQRLARQRAVLFPQIGGDGFSETRILRPQMMLDRADSATAAKIGESVLNRIGLEKSGGVGSAVGSDGILPACRGRR